MPKENWRWPVRVAVYIDWFNFFHHMKKLYWKKYYWLDYKQLAKQFIWHNEKIVKVEYFTAYFFPDKQWEKRHKTYVKALNNVWVQTIFWKYQEVTKKFVNNKNNIQSFLYKNLISKLPKSRQKLFIPYKIEYKNFEEKRTDVNVALHILEDWLLNVYDKAFVISWDSDISPSIKSVKKHTKWQSKEFVLLLPPWAKAHTMEKACDEIKNITEEDLKNSVLPEHVWDIHRPKHRK